MIKEGMECIVLRGRHAGKRVKVTKVIDDLYVMAKGDGIKERRFNKRHLLPIGE